jgi:hypothetical protein
MIIERHPGSARPTRNGSVYSVAMWLSSSKNIADLI